MAKSKFLYICNECDTEHPKWSGQCSNCKSWNTLEEKEKIEQSKNDRMTGYAGSSYSNDIVKLNQVSTNEFLRYSTGFSEMDRVLGGGIVEGSIILIGGDPGIGKSTILTQTLSNLSLQKKVLYVSGEESPSQIHLRAKRLGLNIEEVYILSETNVEKIISKSESFNPDVIVVDSIQTIYTNESKSSPGSTSQVKETASMLNRFGKQNNITIFLVGHVTKDGTIAGPKVLEHVVDTVLYFEGEQGSKYRMLRSIKNRFGEVNEMGVFAMLENGLKEVKNPSSIFLSKYEKEVSGSSLFVIKEASRPLILEIQSLVAESNSEYIRRVSIGVDKDRFVLLTAILQRKVGLKIGRYDIYVSVVGGVKITETACDVPLALSIVSSFDESFLPKDMVSFGEIGLSGEVRPIPNGEERIKEAIKHGMKKIILPKGNLPSLKSNLHESIEIISISDVDDLMKQYNKLSKKNKAH